jgi:type IV secretory pathway TrbD component
MHGAPIHRSLTRPVLLGGAERGPAIINGTATIGLALGPGFHWSNLLFALFLGSAVHMARRWMAKHDPQFFAVYLRHRSYQPNYRQFSDPDAAKAEVRPPVSPYRGY